MLLGFSICLKKTGISAIDDANYADLNARQNYKKQAKLQESRFWEEMFRDRTTTLQADLTRPNQIDVVPTLHVVNIPANEHIMNALSLSSAHCQLSSGETKDRSYTICI